MSVVMRTPRDKPVVVVFNVYSLIELVGIHEIGEICLSDENWTISFGHVLRK